MLIAYYIFTMSNLNLNNYKLYVHLNKFVQLFTWHHVLYMRPKCSALRAFLRLELLCSGWMASSISINSLVNNCDNCVIFSISSGGYGSFAKWAMLWSKAQDWITAIDVSIFKRSPIYIETILCANRPNNGH